MKKITFLSSLFVFVFIFSSFSQPAPVAHYSFNGNAQDVSGNGHHGNVFGDPVLTDDRNGNANSAYQFDGVNDYIEVPYHTDLQPENQVTLALWAFHPDWSGINYFAGLAGNTESGGYGLYIYTDFSYSYLRGYLRRNGYYANPIYDLSDLSAGWHHFVLSYTPGNFSQNYTQLYIDGIEVDYVMGVGNHSIDYAHQNSFIIGAEASEGNLPEGDYWDGKLDDVRVYNVELSADEVMNLYNSTTNTNNYLVAKKELHLFPNPASGSITIQTNFWIDQFEMYNHCGQLVKKTNITSGSKRLDISELEAGVYHVKAYFQDQIIMKKIIIQ